MAIPSEFNALVERLNQELEQIEQQATAGLNFARIILQRVERLSISEVSDD